MAWKAFGMVLSASEVAWKASDCLEGIWDDLKASKITWKAIGVAWEASEMVWKATEMTWKASDKAWVASGII